MIASRDQEEPTKKQLKAWGKFVEVCLCGLALGSVVGFCCALKYDRVDLALLALGLNPLFMMFPLACILKIFPRLIDWLILKMPGGTPEEQETLCRIQPPGLVRQHTHPCEEEYDDDE